MEAPVSCIICASCISKVCETSGRGGAASAAIVEKRSSWRSLCCPIPSSRASPCRSPPEPEPECLKHLHSVGRKELSTLAWSRACCGREWGTLLREIQARLQSGEDCCFVVCLSCLSSACGEQERRLPLRALATLAWSVASSPNKLCTDLLGKMQAELASRMDLQGREAMTSSTDALEVLWASNFAGCLQPQSLPSVWHGLQRVASIWESPATSSPSEAASESSARSARSARSLRLAAGLEPTEPQAVLELTDRVLAAFGGT